MTSAEIASASLLRNLTSSFTCQYEAFYHIFIIKVIRSWFHFLHEVFTAKLRNAYFVTRYSLAQGVYKLMNIRYEYLDLSQKEKHDFCWLY